MSPPAVATAPAGRGNQWVAPELDGVDWSRYDFIDLGCSKGGSLQFCAKRFDAERGLGIDISEKKLRKTRRKGLDAVRGDVRQIRGRKLVRFVSMMQMLEHLPTHRAVERVLARAGRLATDFLYIHHPCFDDEDYLRTHGLQLYYHNWSGHKAHVTTTEFVEMFDRLGFLQYHIRPLLPIADSSHPTVIPTSTPKNQFLYDFAKHGPKGRVSFAHPVHRHLEIFVALRPLRRSVWGEIARARGG